MKNIRGKRNTLETKAHMRNHTGLREIDQEYVKHLDEAVTHEKSNNHTINEETINSSKILYHTHNSPLLVLC
jgi:hypothetical protein